jgi:hypothetical protein
VKDRAACGRARNRTLVDHPSASAFAWKTVRMVDTLKLSDCTATAAWRSSRRRKRLGEIAMTDYRVTTEVACPKCAARPGNPCTNANGSKMPLLHPSRWRVAAGREEGK